MDEMLQTVPMLTDEKRMQMISQLREWYILGEKRKSEARFVQGEEREEEMNGSKEGRKFVNRHSSLRSEKKLVQSPSQT